MSGFAAIVDANRKGELEAEFSGYVDRAARYKSLDRPARFWPGEDCLAAKLDSPSSLHRAAAVDAESGSWLIAAGTLIDTQANAPDGSLRQLLFDYLARGPEVFARCDGLFALLVYNGRARTLAVVSDPFGYFSVFHGAREGRVYIATSGLAVAQQVQSPPGELGVNCFLRTGKVFGEMTIWRDVKRMGAATVLEFSAEGTRETVYWQPRADAALAKLSLHESIEASIALVQQVLIRNLAREGKVWSDLTGGFDTRFMTMFLHRAGLPFKANFVGAPANDDVAIARVIVEKMGWEHRHFQLPATWPDECPAYLPDALGRGDGHLNVLLSIRALWAHRQESQEYPALLSGLGGEMWRGPIWWPEQRTLGQSSAVHYDRQVWSVMHPIDESIFARGGAQPVKDEVIRQFRQVGEREPDAPNTLKLDVLWTYRETAHVGVWASVAAGLVRIIPALFSKDIVTHAISLNTRWKLNNLLVRHIIETCNPALANIEVQGRGPAVPQRLANFHRFIPSRIDHYRRAINKLAEIKLGRSLWPARREESFSRPEWRRSILRFAEAEGLFKPGEMRSGGLYHPDRLRSFLARAGGEDFSHDEFLGRMITLEMALRATGAAVS